MGMCGIIFDLDGVLCYTDHYHYLAWKALADKMCIRDSLISHVQEGKGLQRPGAGLESGKRDPLVAGRQITLLHRDPSLSDLIG